MFISRPPPVGRVHLNFLVSPPEGRGDHCYIHRVLGANGALTGYAGGIDRKRQLLAVDVRPAGLAELI